MSHEEKLPANVRIDMSLRSIRSAEARALPMLNKLRIIDAQIIRLFRVMLDDSPEAVLSEALVGMIALMNEVDQRVAKLGHPALLEHERLAGAKKYLASAMLGVATVPNPYLGNLSPLDTFFTLRNEVWLTIVPRT